MANKEILLFCVIFITICANFTETRAIPKPASQSALIETKLESEVDEDLGERKPGWVRRILMRMGEVASRASNNLGGTSIKIANFVEKVCKFLKTVIPVMAAVCHVGQFKFCLSSDAPQELAEALSGPVTLDLNAPD